MYHHLKKLKYTEHVGKPDPSFLVTDTRENGFIQTLIVARSNRMRFLRTLYMIVLFVSLTAVAAFAQDYGAKQDAKEAGHETKEAAKSAGRATKKAAKKVTHKAAKKTRQGAAKVEEKTEPK
jgi:hypothetical protein